MLIISKILSILFLFVLLACNKNLSEEEREALWDKAQTKGEIVRRSGTSFNLATDEELALSDAKNRLMTGGGLFGKKNLLNFGKKEGEGEENKQSSSVAMLINPYLWRATIETINFMPLSSTDPFAGTIITDWYTSENNIGERCKLNIFIKGVELKTSNLQVSSFCQVNKNNQWVNISSKTEDNIKIENAILNKAKKLKLISG